MNGLKIYTLPGLGFDERIFSKLDFGETEVKHLNWLEPISGESLQNYARRMAEGIEKTGQICLVGHSFGGIVALEISRFWAVGQIVLVSSIKSRAEMPWFFRVVAPLGLWRFFTKNLVLKTFPLWAKAAGYASPEDQTLFEGMIEKQSDNYLRWALKNLSEWQTPPATGGKIFQIHGDCDRSFPISLIGEPFFRVAEGGHFMVFNRTGEVSKFLKMSILSG